MPGLAMDVNQSLIKHENDNTLSGDDESEHTYKSRPQLPQPFVVMRSLAHLIKDLDSGQIDVEPEYQREVVWTADRMTGLVNSLMENFYIPPIILNKKTLSNQTNSTHGSIHVCVDGKQRLSSVRAFVKGMIPCHDFRGEKWWFCDTSTSRRKRVFSGETREVFLSKELVSFEFKNISSEQEEDLFARVQMGVQLSIAEKMRASTGPWQELARLFVDDFPIIYSLMKDRARAKDFQLTLSCFSQIIEVMHPTASDGIPILKTNYNALPKLLSNKSAVDDRTKSHLASVWNTFTELIEQDSDTFTNANKYLRGVQTFAPVEMIAVTVLISMYSETRNNRLLLGDTKAMREAIREQFADIRTNAPLWKFVWNFLENLEAIRGAVDGSTVHRRIGQFSTVSTNATVPESNPNRVSIPGATSERPTPRTKPPSVLPPQAPFAFKREEETPTISPDSRQPKRQRTDPGSANPLASVIRSPNGSVTNPHLSGSQSVSLNLRRTEPSPWQPQYPPMPAHSTAPSPRRTKTKPEKGSGHTSTLSASNGSLPTRYTSYMPTSTPPMPSNVQQIRVSELNNHQKSSTPVTSSASITPKQQPQLAHLQFNSVSEASSSSSPTADVYQQRPPSNSTRTLKTGIGAFTPRYTEQQWEGEIRSTTPPAELASTVHLSGTQSTKKTRKISSRSTLAQYHDAIDLTSDTEQERQDLLLSFKGKTVPTKRPQTTQAPPVPSEKSKHAASDQDAKIPGSPIGN